MTGRSCLCVVLAAGEGTRMKSTLPKVLHKVAGLPMVAHVAAAVRGAGADIALVAGNGSDSVRDAVRAVAPSAETYVQTERLGTAHAVMAARDALRRGYDDLLVVFGDAPLIRSETLLAARERLAAGFDVVVFAFRTERPAGYGRVLTRDGRVTGIREDRDCSDEEKLITLCNGGLMAITGRHAIRLIESVGNDNAKGEYYLTDVVEVAAEAGLAVTAVTIDADDVLGVNNRAELAEAEALWQQRRRRQVMLSGVTMIDPGSVFFSWDTEVGAETVVEPNVWFGPGVKVGRDVAIHAYSHLEGATVGDHVSVGPFARLRPGTRLAEKSKVGNFCEVKQADVGPGAKINHLTYIGDAVIGAGSNIGAGTITCNYDGFSKHVTEIGANVFIGSNSSLVAPVRIGDGAYVASGSVVTESVPDDALALGRARQATKEGRARELRERLAAAKKRG
ncbi:MAG: bifunctional UDP-N-acetylglucosamine diphosphorylase/glucosamine-1-phosphate N-acetyltransferase GlmU [Rhizobiaceae bacterium]|nr:bifunctional UDP-N-acetylglucosamine diphosphorylase/glucosamine-1-phosphate N-acetyltransferase GlmU [Rhizobiaceae bacterium]